MCLDTSSNATNTTGDLDDSKSLKISIGDDIINNAIQHIYNQGRFNVRLDNSMIPESVPFKLNTKYLEDLLPDLYKEYPDKDFVMHIAVVNASPQFAFADKNNTHIGMTILIEIILPNTTYAFLGATEEKTIFSFKSVLSIGILFPENKDHYKLILNLTEVSLSNTQIIVTSGTMTADQLQDTLNQSFSALLFMINENFLSKGILLPKVQNIDFNKNDIETSNGLLSVKVEPSLVAFKKNEKFKTRSN